MRGTFQVNGRVERMTLRLSVNGATGGVDVTDVMLQPGGNSSGWMPHVTELPWAAGVVS